MSVRNTVGPLSEALERRLVEGISKGDRNARRRLIEAYLGMVSALARRYARRWGVPLEDLLQEGALALVQAVDHYDPNRGMKFSTYATWWAKQAIRRAAMAQSRPVRIPERLWDRVEELSRTEQRSGVRAEQEAAGEKPGEGTDPLDQELEEMRCVLRPAISLEAPLGDGAGRIGEILPDPSAEDPVDVVARQDARHRLAEALAALPERERSVLRGRAGFDGAPRSLASLGKSLGVSRERARQLEGAALRELYDRRGELRLEGLAA